MGQWGWGYMCGGEKTRERERERETRKDARKERKNNKKNKKSQLINVTTIFSQYFTINFK